MSLYPKYEKCDICEHKVPEGDIVECEKCGKKICGLCARDSMFECSVCELQICEDCAIYDRATSEYVCSSDCQRELPNLENNSDT